MTDTMELIELDIDLDSDVKCINHDNTAMAVVIHSGCVLNICKGCKDWIDNFINSTGAVYIKVSCKVCIKTENATKFKTVNF